MAACFLLVTSVLLVPSFIWGSAATPFLLLSQVSTLLAVTVSVYLARRWLDRGSFSSLGLRLGRTALIDLLVGFAIAGVLIATIYLIEWGFGWLEFEGFSWQTESIAQVTAGAAVMLLVFLAISWQEELLHRGYWLQNIEEGLNLPWAVLLSSAFFSITHLGNPNFSTAAAFGLLAGGIFLAYGYIRTRQLWLPIGLHIGWNFFEGTVFGFPVSGLSGLPKIVRQTVDGPVLVTGGAFGPEAGLVLLPGLLVGGLLIRFYTRNRQPEPSFEAA